MRFVYRHAALFAVWTLVFEASPRPRLTLIVSLEAIFLSTFVMIDQNRQAAFHQAKADHGYGDINTLLVENTQLTGTIHELTEQLAARVLTPANPPAAATRTGDGRPDRRSGGHGGQVAFLGSDLATHQ